MQHQKPAKYTPGMMVTALLDTSVIFTNPTTAKVKFHAKAVFLDHPHVTLVDRLKHSTRSQEALTI